MNRCPPLIVAGPTVHRRSTQLPFLSAMAVVLLVGCSPSVVEAPAAPIISPWLAGVAPPSSSAYDDPVGRLLIADTVAKVSFDGDANTHFLPNSAGVEVLWPRPLRRVVVDTMGRIEERPVRGVPEELANAVVRGFCPGRGGELAMVAGGASEGFLLIREDSVVAYWPWRPPGGEEFGLPRSCIQLGEVWAGLTTTSLATGNGASAPGARLQMVAVGQGVRSASEVLLEAAIPSLSVLDSATQRQLTIPLQQFPELAGSLGGAVLLRPVVDPDSASLQLDLIDSANHWVRTIHLNLPRHRIEPALFGRLLPEGDSVAERLLKPLLAAGLIRRTISRLIPNDSTSIYLVRGDLSPDLTSSAASPHILDLLDLRSGRVARIEIPERTPVLGARGRYLFLCRADAANSWKPGTRIACAELLVLRMADVDSPPSDAPER